MERKVCRVPSDREEETWSTGIAGERTRLPRAVVTVPTTGVGSSGPCPGEAGGLISIRETKKS